MAKKKVSPKKPKVKAKAKSKTVRIPRQKALPGMENTKIAAIENAALDYVEIRDERQELTKREVELKEKLSKLMHAQGKTEYVRGGISVKLEPEGEKVKVRVRDEDDVPVNKKNAAEDAGPEEDEDDTDAGDAFHDPIAEAV